MEATVFIGATSTIKATMNKVYFSLLFAILCGVASCSSPDDSTDHGKITIAADESLQPMVEQLCQAYKGIHPDTDFNVIFCSEEQAVRYILSDSARLAFITRGLTDNEQNNFKTKGIKYNPQFIATDGVALLTHKDNLDTLTTMNELKNVFSGEYKNWSQLKGGNLKGEIVLVFDNANSSNLNFIMRKFGLTSVKGLHVFSAGSNKKVIEYVRNTPNALGFIGVNWISDGDVPLTAELSKGLRVMGVADLSDTLAKGYHQPFQLALRYKAYPLRRDVYVINREMYPGLGSGMLNYIMRDVGSLIIEKCGLWPSKPFNREVILKKEI